MFGIGGAHLLLFAQGVYSQFFQAAAAREAASRFGGVELTYVATLVSSMLWTAAGAAAASLLPVGGDMRRIRLHAVALSILSPVLALLSYRLSGGLPQLLGWREGLLFSQNQMLVFAMLLPMLFGLANGAIYGTLCRCAGKEEAGGAYASDALGDMLGGLAFSLLLASFTPPLALLSCAGMFLPLLGFWVYGMKCETHWMKAGAGLACLMAMLACSFNAAGDVRLAEARWSRTLPGYRYEGSVETAYGRVEFLKERRGKDAGSLAIYRDSSLEACLPRDLELDCPPALFGILQPDKPSVEALIVCPAFSGMPAALLAMPAMERLDMVCPDTRLVKMAQGIGSLPQESDKFAIADAEPRRFIESSASSYDLIAVVGTEPETLGSNRLFTEEFYRAVAARLKRGGVFMTSIPSSGGYSTDSTAEFNGMLAATLRKVFPKVETTPGETKFIVAGGANVCANFDELDRRAARLMPNAKSFPAGLLGVVFSQSEQEGEARRIAGAALASPANRDLSPTLPFQYLRHYSRMASGDVQSPGLMLEFLEWMFFRWRETLGAIVALYALARYFGSWKLSRKMAFMSFENGFYAMGLAVTLLFMHQSRCGALYRDLAAATGVFIGGAALGSLLAGRTPKGRLRIKWLSLALPALPPLLAFAPWWMALAGVFGGLLLGGCSVGAAYWDFNRRADSERAPGLLWSAEICGGAIGALALAAFLIPAGGFIPCAILLTLCRLPLAISRG